MVKLTLITNGGKKTDIVPESMTIRQIYEKYDVNYDHCTNMVDSVPLRIGDMDKSLRELGVTETVRMSSIVKADNAAEIILAGTTAVVKSANKLEDWKKALEYDPELGLYDDNDEPYFKVFIDEGPGSMNDSGVCFSDVADANGYAVVTILLDPTDEDKKGLAKKKLGNALLNLIEIENNLGEVIRDANEADRKIEEKIRTL